MLEKKTNLVRGLTLATMFALITGAMVGMAWAVQALPWACPFFWPLFSVFL